MARAAGERALHLRLPPRRAAETAAPCCPPRRPAWVYAVYLALGCVRGFTLVPATYLVVAGMLVLPPLAALCADRGRHHRLIGSRLLLRRGHAVRSVFRSVATGRRSRGCAPLCARRELPIVIAWSFFPIAPTDLVCYVCGALKVDLKKCLLGVTIGEGAICAIYIFLGGQALSWLR